MRICIITLGLLLYAGAGAQAQVCIGGGCGGGISVTTIRERQGGLLPMLLGRGGSEFSVQQYRLGGSFGSPFGEYPLGYGIPSYAPYFAARQYVPAVEVEYVPRLVYQPVLYGGRYVALRAW
jgi:hypothetical protein